MSENTNNLVEFIADKLAKPRDNNIELSDTLSHIYSFVRDTDSDYTKTTRVTYNTNYEHGIFFVHAGSSKARNVKNQNVPKGQILNYLKY